MKFRTILLASAAVMFTGSAMAADLTNPFYLPGQGKFASDTTLEYSRGKLEHDSKKYDQWKAAEKLTYGINDNLAVFGALSNRFDTEGDYNNDHNFDYELGASYNMQMNNVLAQFSGSYFTYNPKSFVGHDYPERWQKFITGEAKLGYDMGDGLVPYVTYGFSGQVDENDREFYQTAFAGVHKYSGTWAADAGIRYDYSTDGKNSNAVYAQAEFDYYPMEKLAIGVYGDYYLAGSVRDLDGESSKVDRDYTAGIRAKVEF